MNKLCKFYLAALLLLGIALAVSPARAEDSFAKILSEARECGVFSETLGQVRLSVKDGRLTPEQGIALLFSETEHTCFPEYNYKRTDPCPVLPKTFERGSRQAGKGR